MSFGGDGICLDCEGMSFEHDRMSLRRDFRRLWRDGISLAAKGMSLGNEEMSYGGEFLSLCRDGMSCI